MSTTSQHLDELYAELRRLAFAKLAHEPAGQTLWATALDRLAAHDARKAELVKLRYFVGLTIEQAADAMNVSAPTAKRDWAYARAWLFREIGSQPADSQNP